MIYQYDQALPLPTKDLYDTQIMQMAVAAAKDMYDRGEKRIDEFYDKYGDFYSPIASDVDFVHNETVGKLQKGLADMEAQGIDPLRSSEGRARVAQLIRSVNSKAIANKKRAAKAAEDYIKSREAAIKANTWNPEYERQMLGGQLLEEWDGSLGDWKATSTSPYKDLNARYHHLFDNMQLSYDEEASKNMPGWIVKSKSKKDMETILNANLVDLKSDPQYQYDHNRIKNSLKQANPLLSDADASNKADEILKSEIIDRNHEAYGKTIETDPYYMKAEEHAWQEKQTAIAQQHAINMENLKHQHEMAEIQKRAELNGDGSGKGKSASGVQNHLLKQTLRGLQKFTGSNSINNNDIVKAATVRGDRINNGDWDTERDALIKDVSEKHMYDPKVIVDGLHRETKDKNKSRVNGVYMTTDDVRRLHSDDDVVSSMAGVSKPLVKTKTGITNPNNATLQFTSEGMTLPGRDHRAHHYVKVHVYNDNGTLHGTYWYELSRSKKQPAAKLQGASSKSGKRVYTYDGDKDYDITWDPYEEGFYSAISNRMEYSLGGDRKQTRVDDISQ